GIAALAAAGALVYMWTGGDAAVGGTAEVAAHTVEPADGTAPVALPDRAAAPAEAPAAEVPAAPASPPMAKQAEPIARRSPHRPAPARTGKASRSPQRRGAARAAAAPTRAAPPPLAVPDGGAADPDTPARLAAATAPPAVQAGPDLSVSRLIQEYRQVGQAIARLHGRGDSSLASGLRDRYFQLPYADALRIPAVRRDTLAQLARLRRDLAAASTSD
ncbi:MAG TPA: hypothetical protein VFU21_16040, partial [Kofleriaceae bacterium]|nr:hypothetical protein [Kofleriaceae bacterium]